MYTSEQCAKKKYCRSGPRRRGDSSPKTLPTPPPNPSLNWRMGGSGYETMTLLVCHHLHCSSHPTQSCHGLPMLWQPRGSTSCGQCAGEYCHSSGHTREVHIKGHNLQTMLLMLYLQSTLIYLVLSLARCSTLQQDFYQLLVVMHCGQVQSSQAILHGRRRCSVSEPFSSTALSVSTTHCSSTVRLGTLLQQELAHLILAVSCSCHQGSVTLL